MLEYSEFSAYSTIVQPVVHSVNLLTQASPGVLHEATFRALDWLLDEARTQGLRVILSFCDNWKYPGHALLSLLIAMGAERSRDAVECRCVRAARGH
jgi:hypothetical protein